MGEEESLYPGVYPPGQSRQAGESFHLYGTRGGYPGSGQAQAAVCRDDKSQVRSHHVLWT